MSMARGNAPASQKFRRSPSSPAAQKRGKDWAHYWSAFNRQASRRLRGLAT